MSVNSEVRQSRSHADCSVYKTVTGVQSAIAEAYRTELSPLWRAVGFMLSYASPTYCYENKLLAAKSELVATQLDEITILNCSDNCANCVWSEALSLDGHEEAYNLISRALEDNSDALTPQGILKLIDQEVVKTEV
jgi:hypothetical protein